MIKKKVLVFCEDVVKRKRKKKDFGSNGTV